MAKNDSFDEILAEVPGEGLPTAPNRTESPERQAQHERRRILLEIRKQTELMAAIATELPKQTSYLAKIEKSATFFLVLAIVGIILGAINSLIALFRHG